MICPECRSVKNKVIRTWENKARNTIRRVRWCPDCKKPWTTTELTDERELKNRT